MAGTVLGLAAVLVWTWRWWRETRPQPIPSYLLLRTRLRIAVVGVLVAVPLLMGAAGAVQSVQDLRAENLVDRSSLPPGIVVPQWGGTDMAELALRTFVQDAVKGAVVVLALYAIGRQLSRLSRGERA